MKFVIRIQNELLHELLQRIASRAYEIGRRDAAEGRMDEKPEERVPIKPDHLKRFT